MSWPRASRRSARLADRPCNPYDSDRSPRRIEWWERRCRRGEATLAVAFGSDTCGSIRIPSAVHNLFGLRPTKGLSSISGIVPLSHTAGRRRSDCSQRHRSRDRSRTRPSARTRRTSATRILGGRQPASFVAALDSTSLRGALDSACCTEHFGTEARRSGGHTHRSDAALASMKARRRRGDRRRDSRSRQRDQSRRRHRLRAHVRSDGLPRVDSQRAGQVARRDSRSRSV